MTKRDLVGLTVAEIKSQYPKGSYKSSMKKDDVIKAACSSVKAPKSGTASKNTER